MYVRGHARGVVIGDRQRHTGHGQAARGRRQDDRLVALVQVVVADRYRDGLRGVVRSDGERRRECIVGVGGGAAGGGQGHGDRLRGGLIERGGNLHRDAVLCDRVVVGGGGQRQLGRVGGHGITAHPDAVRFAGIGLPVAGIGRGRVLIVEIVAVGDRPAGCRSVVLSGGRRDVEYQSVVGAGRVDHKEVGGGRFERGVGRGGEHNRAEAARDTRRDAQLRQPGPG